MNDAEAQAYADAVGTAMQRHFAGSRYGYVLVVVGPTFDLLRSDLDSPSAAVVLRDAAEDLEGEPADADAS